MLQWLRRVATGDDGRPEGGTGGRRRVASQSEDWLNRDLNDRLHCWFGRQI